MSYTPHHTEDAQLIADAMSYVDALHQDLAAQNTAPAPGVEGRVVEAILADPALAQGVRNWAERNRVLEARIGPPEHPPFDEVYRRVKAMLISAGDQEAWPPP